MRILHINANYISSPLHQNMIDRLNTFGFDNAVFVPAYKGRPQEVSDRDYAVISRCFRRSDRYLFYLKQAKILSAIEVHYKEFNFDCIHAYTLFTDGNTAMCLAKQHNIPYVVAVRDTDVNDFFGKRVLLRCRGVKILENAAAVFFLSPVYKAQVLDKYVPANLREKIESKCHIIPNGIDDFWIENAFTKDAKGAAERMRNEKDIRCIFAGKIIKRKNVETTLKALTKLNERGYKAALTVVGDKTDRNIYEKLKTYECFRYTEPKKKEELINYYRDADIFVMPSLTETFGLVYAEAMSQGLPVIYTKGQGFDGQFDEGVVGYHTDSSSTKELISAIESIIDNYERISADCTNAVSKFAWKAITAKYADIYGGLV